MGVATDVEAEEGGKHSGGGSEKETGVGRRRISEEGDGSWEETNDGAEGINGGTKGTFVVVIGEKDNGRLDVGRSFGDDKIFDGVGTTPFSLSPNFSARNFVASPKISFPVVFSSQVFRILSASELLRPDALTRRCRRRFSSADWNSSKSFSCAVGVLGERWPSPSMRV